MQSRACVYVQIYYDKPHFAHTLGLWYFYLVLGSPFNATRKCYFPRAQTYRVNIIIIFFYRQLPHTLSVNILDFFFLENYTHCLRCFRFF